MTSFSVRPAAVRQLARIQVAEAEPTADGRRDDEGEEDVFKGLLRRQR